ncbi:MULTISPECIES: GNAT family N-acetyltransferase [unclassified Pseudomonas]|uniref:GNAT family N-acetyltransferase n=1 Tax=unclassified Pseudomonas TaxID=196821 RepID=UPI000BD50950|nr:MULTISPECIES: GNAT family N-acetyltransferase [unclassified Pseudomonas]PVZ13771.1 phosphinothricin acetyltransferase [Pseudomonas sp. URIL14HWK12:I12]PVZ24077.1 phosphinothricin acetyltransferase [Pseudomonas sp. URIL14HWK12:I10]PVZ33284.1 phosphinothricin acetyltransferase [Pseudomonas sp. URIL14HWK12:I11]SNZ11002.1 phosphinothricin acetyltransferase [Pseudomonas sp. URIL14HWK12:I9]
MTFSTIRPALLADRAAAWQVLAHPGSAMALAVEIPHSEIGTGALIEATLGRYPFLVAQAPAEGAVQGLAWASAHRAGLGLRWSVDVHVHALPGPGQAMIAETLYKALIQALAEEGFLALYVALPYGHDHDHPLHAALGFSPIGRPCGADLPTQAQAWCLTLNAGQYHRPPTLSLAWRGN